MKVTVEGKDSTDIDDETVRRVLSMFPEEELHEREVFREAFETGVIRFKDLKKECSKILIPWQMFFLFPATLEKQLRHIEDQRKGKVSEKLFAKRRGEGDTVSRRILDRLIRQQDYLTSASAYEINRFCGALKGLSIYEAASRLVSYFQIDRPQMWANSSKESALNYLISKVEAKNVNVSRGVLTNKLLPMSQVVPSNVYRDTSGFVIRDEKVPFVFLPSEINPSEVASRQIYTLIFLLATIGLERYDHVLDKDFGPKMLRSKGLEAELHSIVAEVLMPASEVGQLKGSEMSEVERDRLAERFKVSPLALVTSLRVRKILSHEDYEALKPAPFVAPKGKKEMRPPKVLTSVGKFCGRHSVDAINQGLRSGSLTNVQAQYLIWGSVNKSYFRKYRKDLSL